MNAAGPDELADSTPRGGFSIYRLDLPLLIPFKHAAATRRRNSAIWVKLEDHSGQIGLGEALPRSYVTGEAPEEIVQALYALSSSLRGLGPEQILENLAEFDTEAQPRGYLSATGALELAAFDLLSRTQGAAVWKILALPDPRLREVPVTCTVPILPPRAAQLLVLAAGMLGSRHYKVKLSGAMRTDRLLLSRVLAVLPRGADMRVDLNGALRPDGARSYLESLASDFPMLSWIEEPIEKHSVDFMADLSRHFGGRFVFCADESLCTAKDLDRILQRKLFSAVNIRVGKHGGLRRTLALAQRAAAAGLAVQVGALVGESACLSNSGAIVAGALADLRYAELGLSQILIRGAPVQGGVRVARGFVLNTSRLPHAGLADHCADWRERLGTPVNPRM